MAMHVVYALDWSRSISVGQNKKIATVWGATLNKQTLLAFFEHAPDLYYSVDPATGCIRDCNQTLADKTGRPKDEIRGLAESELFSEDDRAELETYRSKIPYDEAIENKRLKLLRKNADPLPVSWSAFFPQSDDHSLYWTALRDISPLVEVEQELKEQTKELEESNESLQQFAYLASHDLQEPLRMVASYTELLSRRYSDELDERASKYIDYAVDGAKRMKRLINDLLEYSRVNSNSGKSQVLNTDKIVQDVLANLKVRIQERNAKVDIGDLPNCRGRKSQITRVFQNLVANGIKFHDEEPIEIEISGQQQGGSVEFRVSDNGIGFDASNADRIFGVFQRMHERDRFNGTGTGLAIVDKIVRQHGGEISFESELGEGSTFMFELPSAPSESIPEGEELDQ